MPDGDVQTHPVDEAARCSLRKIQSVSGTVTEARSVADLRASGPETLLGISFVFADLDVQVGLAYSPNRMGFHNWDGPREKALRDALIRCLAPGMRSCGRVVS